MVIISNAIENIKANKLKVFVAMIWIILGVTLVVIVSSIGRGIESKGDDTSSEFRRVNVIFNPNYENVDELRFFQPFTYEDINFITSIEGVDRVTPIYGQVKNEENSYFNIKSDNEDSFSALKTIDDEKLEIIEGRNFTKVDQERNTVLLNQFEVEILFKDKQLKDIIGKPVEINGKYFEIIGIFYDKKSHTSSEKTNYISKKGLEEINKLNSYFSGIGGFEVEISSDYNMSEVAFKISDKFQERIEESTGIYATLDKNAKDLWQIKIMQQEIKQYTSMLSSASLLVGGIGIMNIMYLSVTERKREIGIRRAIGATPKDILVQFLIETVIITIMGGIIGSVVGFIATIYVENYLGISAVPSIDAYIKAILVSILTGVVFGLLPASKASKMSPIEAIQG